MQAELERKKKGQTAVNNKICPLVAPTGIEPVSSESESEILSIKLRSRSISKSYNVQIV